VELKGIRLKGKAYLEILQVCGFINATSSKQPQLKKENTQMGAH
jgi:hypothetical protein